MRSLRVFAKLARPRHTAQITGIVAVISIMNHGFSQATLLAVISSLLTSIAVFIFDDAQDVESDRIVHPERPIPRGSFTVRQGYLVSATLMLVAALIASRLEFHQFAIFLASIVIAASIVFLNIKSTLRAFLVALLIWVLFPFAGFLDLKSILFGTIVALPHVGGTIAKDFVHAKGDVTQGLKAPPYWSKYLASATLFLSSGIVWIPFISDLVKWYYVPPIVFTAASCIILGAEILREDYQKVYVYGGIGMVSSLAAFLLGSF